MSTNGAAAKLVMRILTCLFIYLFDTYTSKVNAALPLNPNLILRDDRTQSLPYTPPGWYHDRKSNP